MIWTGPLPVPCIPGLCSIFTEGRAYSAAEYRAWLSEVGLVPGKIVPTRCTAGCCPRPSERGLADIFLTEANLTSEVRRAIHPNSEYQWPLTCPMLCLCLGLFKSRQASSHKTTEIWKSVDEFVVLAPRMRLQAMRYPHDQPSSSKPRIRPRR